MKKTKNQKLLTLDTLASYNQEVLFPWMQDNLVAKKAFGGLRKEFKDFKNESLTNQDAMLKKINILLTEKTVREHQEKKEKKFWAIIVRALQEHRILSPRKLQEIAQLEIF